MKDGASMTAAQAPNQPSTRFDWMNQRFESFKGQVSALVNDAKGITPDTLLRSRKYVAMGLSVAVAAPLFSSAAMGWLAYVATAAMSAGIYAVFYHLNGANVLRKGIKLPPMSRIASWLDFGADHQARPTAEQNQLLDKIKALLVDIGSPEAASNSPKVGLKDLAIRTAKIAVVYSSFYFAATAFTTVATPLFHAMLAMGGTWGLMAGYAAILTLFYTLGKMCDTTQSPAEQARLTELLTTLLIVGFSVTVLVLFTPVTLLASLMSTPAIIAMALPVTLISCMGMNAFSGVYEKGKAQWNTWLDRRHGDQQETTGLTSDDPAAGSSHFAIEVPEDEGLEDPETKNTGGRDEASSATQPPAAEPKLG